MDQGLPPPDGTAAAVEIRLLHAQLVRMRGMLFGYSERFFSTIRSWAIISIALLVLGMTEIAPAAVLLVPFIVPFAFLETGYLFFYTVFARRHAERVERAINARLGRDVLVAHRLEAAYFYPPDAPKLAALSFGNPLGFVSVMTIGYAAGAVLIWAAAIIRALDITAAAGGALGVAVPLAVAWTAAIAGYLAWTFLSGHDERRLLAELDRAYGPPVEAASRRE
jgi:hypothetical protein